MIFINARFLSQPITGVQRFSLELCKQLNNIRDDLCFIVPSIDSIIDKSLLKTFNLLEVKGGDGHYWEQIILPRYLKSQNNPILINLCSTAPVFYKNQIVTHHDITYIRHPASFSFKFKLLYKILIPKMLRSAKRVITVSNFSKKEISSFYNVDINKFKVIYNAVNESFISKETISVDSLNKKYCLAVSSLNEHKNFRRMIEAFLASKVKLDLYIIGGQVASFNNIDYQADPRVKFLGRIDDQTLIKLYQGAEFFIFPSLYEGFGIPPLEAQACGCPVVASNVASIPEVLEKSALYFDPYNIDEIASQIEKISQDNVLREKLIYLGFENIKRFSWYKSAIELNHIINEVM